jgi:stage II sporulation protein AA (anti-sigma F factor antagonist)
MACAVKSTDGRLPCFEVTFPTDTTRSYAKLRGELDLATAPRLERLLDELCRDGYRQITLDMSGLQFLGASALSVFVRVDQALRAAGGELVLTRPSRMASRILSITGLDTTLTIR